MDDVLIIAGVIILVVVVFTTMILVKLEKIEKKLADKSTKIKVRPVKKSEYDLPDKIMARVSTSSSKENEHPLYGKCAYCGKRVYLPYKCNYCGKIFCDEHRLPFQHACEGMDEYKTSKPPGGGRIVYRKKR